MRAYAVFEGGGAKGLAHIGALKATEDLGITWVGVAGTSAGALIAALTAAGFKADEICRLEAHAGGHSVAQHVLREFCDKAPQDLFQPGNWSDFEAFRADLLNCMERMIDRQHLAAAGAGVKLLWKHGRNCAMALRNRGWFDTSTMVAEFDRILSKKVDKRGPFVTFDDMPIDLRVVTADVQRARPLVFDRIHHGDTPVALAVAASIAVPGLMQPVAMQVKRQNGESRTLHLLDGGMASNLPAWLFEDDSALSEEEVPIFAFSLAKGLTTVDRTDEFLAAVFRTAVFGSQEIPLRQLGSLFEINISTSKHVATLDMAISKENAGTIIHASRNESFDILKRIIEALGTVIPDTLDALAKGLAAKVSREEGVTFSASMALLGGDKHLKVRFQSSPSQVIRPTVQLHIEKSVAGHAFLSRDVVVFGHNQGLKTIRGVDNTFEPRPRLPDDIRTLVSVPIFEDPSAVLLPVTERNKLWPLGVVTFETTADVWEPLQEEALRSRLLKQSAVWSALLTGMHVWRSFNGRD